MRRIGVNIFKKKVFQIKEIIDDIDRTVSCSLLVKAMIDNIDFHWHAFKTDHRFLIW